MKAGIGERPSRRRGVDMATGVRLGRGISSANSGRVRTADVFDGPAGSYDVAHRMMAWKRRRERLMNWLGSREVEAGARSVRVHPVLAHRDEHLSRLEDVLPLRSFCERSARMDAAEDCRVIPCGVLKR